MAGRRVLLILSLVPALRTTAGAQSLPLIVQISPTANIGVITTTLAATVIDSIPDANTYLLNAPALPPSAGASSLGIWFGLCEPVELPIQ
ncbi:MAG: hypothetical protein AUI91_15745 [Acidobacteria bacterium 13_1_40CM_3_56_11]|nr:MAG: hypothetical protein AUI91_15745 [Acidobacteria bacterium 13_1_40CM_3_56_11]